MSAVTVQYRGYEIVVTPVKDHEDLWDYTYTLSKDGAAPLSGSGTAGGHLTPEAGSVSGVEVAKIEVDNLLALQQR